MFLRSNPIYISVAVAPQIRFELHLLLFTLTHELNRPRYDESEIFLLSHVHICVFSLSSSALPLHFLWTVICDLWDWDPMHYLMYCLGYCIVCNCSNFNHSLNPMLQKLTHYLSHISNPYARNSLSGFNYLPSPLNFSKFQCLPLSSIPPNLSRTPMAKLPWLQLATTESYTAATSGDSCWCGLLLS